MSSAEPATPHGAALPTEGILGHFAIAIPEDHASHQGQNGVEDPVAACDSSFTSTTLSGAGSGSTAQTTLITEEPEANKAVFAEEAPKEEDSPIITIPPEPTSLGNDGSCREKEGLSTLPRWRKWSLFACSCLLQFLLQLDMAAIAVTLPVRRWPTDTCTHALLGPPRVSKRED